MFHAKKIIFSLFTLFSLTAFSACNHSTYTSSINFSLPDSIFMNVNDSVENTQNCSVEITVTDSLNNVLCQQIWEFNFNKIQNKKYNINELPAGSKVNIEVNIFINKKLTFTAQGTQIILAEGRNEIFLTLTKVTSKENTETDDSDKGTTIPSIPKGFVKVIGKEIDGDVNTNNYEGVFIKGRTVTLSDFYIGQYEVTQREYKNVMQDQKVTVDGTEYTLEAEPSLCTEANKETYAADTENYGNHPVENVSWYDAVYYCNARSEKENLEPAYTITVTALSDINHITAADVTLDMTKNGYRLPTEAEWEYAARGGDPDLDNWNDTFSGANTASETSYNASSNSGLDTVGWYSYNNKTGTTENNIVTKSSNGKGTHQVGQLKPNRLNIFDMSGNVWEWCYDWYDSISTSTEVNPTGAVSETQKVTRGGSWNEDANYAAVCNRTIKQAPSSQFKDLGFRVVRSCKD